MTAHALPSVGVVVLAFGPEPQLDPCLAAVRRSVGVHVELLVVDNGCTNPDLAAVVDRYDGRLVQPATNLGYAAGCNLGVASLPDEQAVALVNSDAIVESTALRTLVDALTDDVGIATGSLRLADAPELMNSAGNPVHFTGISWAGGMGEQATAHAEPRDVASASGAAMALRRSLWDELGGFDEAYFTYLEDTELSLRCWLSGRRVVYVPDAVTVHHYEFSRNERKHYYLERNRLLLLLTVYERRTLVLLAPALLLWEVCVAATALLQGWWPSKLRGWMWLLRNRDHVRQRRRLIHDSRTRGDAVLADLLEGSITPPHVPLPPGFGLLNAALAGYWRVARRALARQDRQLRRPGSASAAGVGPAAR